ncbi:MAG: cytochrome c3 family protein [Pelovirga sp.]
MKLYLHILIAGVLLILTAPAVAQEFDRCDDCHAQILERDRMQMYQHQPFIQQECRSCHAVAEEAAAPTPGRAGSPKGLDRRRVTWLEEGAMAKTEHRFLLPADKLGDVLVVEVHDEQGGLKHTELPVPHLVDVATVADAGRSPVITDVEVLEVRRGVFLSVTIGWKSDTLTNAQVYYGLGDMSQSVSSGGNFGTQHQVVLNQLKAGKTYHYKVVSRDLFGREQESQSLTFSTARPVSRSMTTAEPADNKGPEIADSNFQRVGSDYLFSLELATPATVYIGRKGVVRKQVAEAAATATTATTGNDKTSHEGLSTGSVLTINACRNCHQRQTTATHPVGVLPKSGMEIPPEYPTLPDGRISCISCHAVHGSNNEYLARKPGRRDLCVGCHRDML